MRGWLEMCNVLSTAACVVAVSALSLLGCAADRPTSSPPTQKEIRGDSDRFFEKLKQEEREHGKSHESPVR